METKNRYDAVVVGAGIIGLAHAYHLVRAGQRVLVVERGQRAVGASIRNFGMVWPIGQPPGKMYEMALRSREIWLDVLSEAGIWHERCGSMHLAYHQYEADVLVEFEEKAGALGYGCQFIPPSGVTLRSPAVRREGLLGALWSPTELCVSPRQTTASLPDYLTSLGVEIRFGTAVSAIESNGVVAGGQQIRSDRILLCTGDDFETLFPGLFAESGLNRCKLQMMKLRHGRTGFRIGTHLCAGLTLGHYANFKVCESLPGALERIYRQHPSYECYGIHLLVSQHEDGCLTVGDSHEYGLAPDPFLKQEIDQLILDYLNTFLDTSEFDVTERWSGVYAKHKELPYFVSDPIPGVRVVTGVGGAGMTLSFGLAEEQTRDLVA
ncbi:MAG: TIGR03364 family FAD-dependent oxidoreductase [Fimbriimonas sp.]|nr:TIGR03364 family FAD-dependent oxidoreductase [Fimbriimonas sp.]